jgi:hypothetical protein
MEVRILQRFGIGRLISLKGYPIAFKNRPTNQYGALCARANLPILSADRLFRSEIERGWIVIRFFVMALSNVARQSVNCDYLVDPVCALAAHTDQKIGRLKSLQCAGDLIELNAWNVERKRF